MVANVYSTLGGKLVGKHPTLGVFVSEGGMVLMPHRFVRVHDTKVEPTRWDWEYGKDRGNGYLRVMVKGKTYSVHRIVAETFISNPDNKPTVDHIDRNRKNNTVSNLRWANRHEQNLNTEKFENARDYGVREFQDKNEYAKAYSKATYKDKKKDLEWYAKFLESCRKSKERRRRKLGIKERKPSPKTKLS